MYFIVRCTDKPGRAEMRAATRERHVAFLRSLGTRLKIAGPTLAEDGETSNGSLLIVEAPSRAEAEALVAEDPYAEAGLFESVTITPWRWTFGEPAA